MSNVFDDIIEPNTYEQALDYANKVQDGTITANKYEKLAVSRFFNDLKRDDLVMNVKAATKALQFFNYIKLTKGIGAGNYFKLEGWQAFIIVNIFGFYWKQTEDEIKRQEQPERRYNYAHIEVARKNGKSTLSAAIALIMLLIDGEARPEVYTTATKRDQAKIVFNEAVEMINQSPALSKHCTVRTNDVETSAKMKKGEFKPLASDSKRLDGLNIHCAIVDEIHEHKDRKLYDVLKSGTGSRINSLISTITTAGFNKYSFAYRHRKVCCEVLEGLKVDDTQFIMIFTLDEDDDWQDPKVWRKANPNIGVSVRPKQLQDACTQAQNNPSEKVNYLTKHMNLWEDAETTWIANEIWKQAEKRPVEELEGFDCWVGIDLAAVSDITAVVFAFPIEEYQYIQLIPLFYLPEDTVKKDKNYSLWVDEGYIKTTPGNVTDYDYILKDVLQMSEVYNIQRIYIDKWNAYQFWIDLEAELPEMTQGIRQGYHSLAAPTKEFERRAMLGQIIHNDNPVLAWMLNNVVLDRDSNANIKINKAKSGDKIDGIAAAINALAAILDAYGCEQDDELFYMV